MAGEIENNHMTNLEKLIEIIKSNNGVELYNWMERFAYWVDPGGYFDVGDWVEYSEKEYTEE